MAGKTPALRFYVLKSVHDEWFEWFSVEDGFFDCYDLVFEFASDGGSFLGLLAGELSFHPFFVCYEEAFFAFGVEIDAAVAWLEVVLRVECAVADEV